MSSKNDDTAASNRAKRPRPSRVSDVHGNEDNRNNTDDHSAASSKTTFVVRTTGAPVTQLISVTISTPYVRPPNEPNAIKSLKGTKLEPLRALLAPLPERFITTIVTQSRAALDLSSKIKQRESSYSRFTERIVVRDEHGKAVTDAESGAPVTEQFIPRSIRDKNPVRCSDDVKEDIRIVAVMQRTLARHEKYKSEQATDIQEVSKLEINIMKERLSTLFLNAAFKYAKVIHIMEKNEKNYRHPPRSTRLGAPRRRPRRQHVDRGGKEACLHIPNNPSRRLRQTTWHKRSRDIRPLRGSLHKNNCENPQTNPTCVHPPPNQIPSRSRPSERSDHKHE